MKKLLELIEDPRISGHLPSALWLTSPKNRAEGRSTCLAIAFILNAIQYPGERIKYFDHHGTGHDVNKFMMEKIGSLCDYITVDKHSVVCNRLTKSLSVPENKIKDTIYELAISLARLARENNIDTKELIEVMQYDYVSRVINT